MKKVFIGFGIMSMFVCAFVLNVHAVEPNTINRSSHVAAANSTGYIESEFLDKVNVTFPTAGGVLELYNSTFTTSVLIASVSLAAVTSQDFDDTKVKGLFWRASTNTNGVTIIYKNK